MTDLISHIHLQFSSDSMPFKCTKAETRDYTIEMYKTESSRLVKALKEIPKVKICCIFALKCNSPLA